MSKCFNVTFGETIENPYELPIASSDILGGVKIGNNINIDENGVISTDAYELPIANADTLGGVKIGDNIDVDENGVISIQPYTLPVATDQNLGGIKIGEGLTIDNNGVVSVDYIHIAQGTITIGTNSVTILYSGNIIGLMAWQDGNFVLTNLNCDISNNQITFTIGENATSPIACTVIYF